MFRIIEQEMVASPVCTINGQILLIGSTRCYSVVVSQLALNESSQERIPWLREVIVPIRMKKVFLNAQTYFAQVD